MMGTEDDESPGFAGRKEMKGFGGEGSTPPDPTLCPWGFLSPRLPVGYRSPPDRGSDSREPSGNGRRCSHRVGGTPRGARGAWSLPVGLKTEPGPAAPLMFSFFSSPTFYFPGGPSRGVSWGFDWIPTSRGLFHSSPQGRGPNPIGALCLLPDRVRPCLYSKGYMVHIP